MDKTFVEEDFMMTGMGGANGNNQNMFGAAFQMQPNNGAQVGMNGMNIPMNMGPMQNMMYMGVPNMNSMFNGSASNSVDDLTNAAIEFPPELGGPEPAKNSNTGNVQQTTSNPGMGMDPSMLAMNQMMGGMNPMYMNHPVMQQMQYNPMFGGFQPQNLSMLQQHQLMQQQQYMQLMQAGMFNPNTPNPGMMNMQNTQVTNQQPTPTSQSQNNPQPSAAASPANNNGSWRTPADDPQRKDVISRIIRFLQMQKPNAPPDWIRRLPQMARKLEEALYRKAVSKAEYNDMSTLQQRLHVVAQEFKNKDWRSAADDVIRQDLIHRIVSLLQAQNPNATPDWINRLPHMAKKLEEMLYQKATSKAEYTDNSRLKERLQVVATEIHKSSLVNKNREKVTPKADPKMEALAMPAELNNPFLEKAKSIASFLTPRTISDYNQKVLTMIQNIGQHRVVLLRQQQRLMQLRHACECKVEKCTQPSCSEMKPLWAHIQTCRQSEICSTAHCISSKYVLAHYQQCMKSTCVVCATLNQPPGLASNLNQTSMMMPQQMATMNNGMTPTINSGMTSTMNAGMNSTMNTGMNNTMNSTTQHAIQMPPELRAEGTFASKARSISSTLPENIIRDYHQKVDFMMSDTGAQTREQHQNILQRQQQRLIQLRHASECRVEKCLQPSCGEMKPLWNHILTCRMSDTCQTPHCVSSKYVLAHFQHCMKQSCVVCQPLRDIKTESNMKNATQEKIQQFTEKAKHVSNLLTTRQTQDYHAKVLGMMHTKVIAQNQTILERQQQRLLQLRHALFCNVDKCVATYCAEMKKLWAHVINCKKSESCPYAHCLSSKYVLSHFQQCTNPLCVVCALVRDPVEMEKTLNEEARQNSEKKEIIPTGLKRTSSLMEPEQQASQKKLKDEKNQSMNETNSIKNQTQGMSTTQISKETTPSIKTELTMIDCPPDLLSNSLDLPKEEFNFMDETFDEELGNEALDFDDAFLMEELK